MKSSEKRYEMALQLFCATDHSLNEIAEITGIPRRSIYHRAKEYNWEALRKASLRSPAILVEEMYQELSALTAAINARPLEKRIPTSQEAETRRKIIASIMAIKKFPTQTEVFHILNSLKRYARQYQYLDFTAITSVVDNFLAAKDLYGYKPWQPEFAKDPHAPTEVQIREAYHGTEDPTLPPDDLSDEDTPIPGQEFFADDPEPQFQPEFPHKKPLNFDGK